MNSTIHHIQLDGWLCNGGIDPLITSVAQLMKVCNSYTEIPAQDYREAVRYAAIHMEAITHLPPMWEHGKRNDCTSPELDAIAMRYFDEIRVPGWKRARPIMKDTWTTAQLLAKHGNTSCLAQCEDVEDLIQAIRLAGSYNGFEAELAITGFRSFNRAQFYNAKNPNNGRDLFTYEFGWEGSLVIYVSFNPQYGRKLLPGWRDWCDLPPSEFIADCGQLGRALNADESSLQNNTGIECQWRFLKAETQNRN